MGDAEDLEQGQKLHKRLIGFTYEAKHETSRTGTDSEAKTPAGTTRHEYKKGPWQYTHEYAGIGQGGGTEIVSFEGKPVWMLNYFGTARDECLPFLTLALSNPPMNCPLRGPRHYTDADYEYYNLQSLTGSFPGSIEDFMQFRGKEYIARRKDRKLMFAGFYHGGLIQQEGSVSLPEMLDNPEILRLYKPWRAKKSTADIHRMRIAGHKLIIRAEHLDNILYNLGIDLRKGDSTLTSVLNAFAEAVSIGLQHGVPLKEFIDKFTFTKFEPCGPVDHPQVKLCTSVIDCAFRVLALEYLGIDDYAWQPRKPAENISPEKTEELANSLFKPYCPDCGELKEPEGKAYKCPECGEKPQAQEGKPEEPKKDADLELCSNCGSPVLRCGSVYKCLSCGNCGGA